MSPDADAIVRLRSTRSCVASPRLGWRAGRTFDHRPTADTHLFLDTNPLVSSYATKTWASSVPGVIVSVEGSGGSGGGGSGRRGRSSYTSLAASALKDRWKPRTRGGSSCLDIIRCEATVSGPTSTMCATLEMTVARGALRPAQRTRPRHATHDSGARGNVVREEKVATSLHLRRWVKTGRGFGVKETGSNTRTGFASVRVSRRAVKCSSGEAEMERGCCIQRNSIPENPKFFIHSNTEGLTDGMG